jgi:hypothetical protein
MAGPSELSPTCQATAAGTAIKMESRNVVARNIMTFSCLVGNYEEVAAEGDDQ